MIPYFIFAILIVIFYHKKKPKCMLFLIVIFSVIRYDVGWDYMNYYDIILKPDEYQLALERYSILWSFFFSLMYALETPHLTVVIPNILTYLILYSALKKLCRRNKKKISDALFVYIFWPFFYLASFSTIRQQLAVALSLMIFAFFIERRYLYSIASLFVCYLLHPSSIVCLLFVPIFLFYNKIRLWHVLLASVGSGVALGMIPKILELIGTGALLAYQHYLNDTDSFGSKLVYLNILMIFALLYISKKYKGFDRFTAMITIFAFISEVMLYLFSVPSVISRIFIYFNIWLVFSILPFGKRGTMRYKNVLRICLVLLFFTYLFIIKTDQSGGSSGFIPYKTIIFSNRP